MANIYSTQTVYLYTTVSGGLQPYDQCARWAGGWTANNGTTGALTVTPPGPGLPYIDSNNTPCAIPGTDGGSLTGTLMPNGFTGSVSVWVDVADSSGIFKESNTKTYTVLPVTALVVNAGPDRAISGVGPNYLTITGAGATGGTPPYTWAWSQDFPGDNPEISYFTTSTSQNPDIEEFNSNGIYYFQLTATDSLGQTGTDEMQVTVTGATPPAPPIPAAAISWSMTRDLYALGQFKLERRRGGVTSTLVNTPTGTSGTIPVGNAGIVVGDQIRITASCADGTGGNSSNVNIKLERQLRNPPNTSNVEYNVINSDPGGSPVFEYVPSQFGWTTALDPTAYWYNIEAGASLY
jgi:hypothetical protein